MGAYVSPHIAHLCYADNDVTTKESLYQVLGLHFPSIHNMSGHCSLPSLITN